VLSALVIALLAGGVRAAEADAPTERGNLARAPAHQPGQLGVMELNALAGAFVGFRLKGIVHPARALALALEGLWGGRIVTADGDLLRAERGGGVRAELPISSFGRNAAILAPGADVLYLPRVPAHSPTVFHLLDYHGRDAALMLAPNLDFTVLHEFAAHACVLVGLRAGAVVALTGHDGSGNSLAGALRPEGGLFAGVRL
jgi:hypothetical protein